MRKRKNLFLFLLVFIFCFLVANAHATMNETFGIDAKSAALGGAFSAYADDFSAMHYNPAGLTQMKGLSASFGAQFCDINHQQRATQVNRFGDNGVDYGIDPVGNRHWTGNDSSILFVPAAGLVYKPEDSRWTFGYGAYVPYGIHMWLDSDGSMKSNGTEVYNNRIIYAAPSVGYEINDKLSVGFSLGMGMADEGASMVLRFPSLAGLPGFSPGDGYATDLTTFHFNVEDHTTYSANIGLLWKATDKLTFGLTYRSESQAEMRGTSKFFYTPEALVILEDLKMPADPVERFHTKLTFRYPQSVTGGVKIAITEKWRFMVDAVWTEWSVRETDNIRFDGSPTIIAAAQALGSGEPADALIIQRHWEDTLDWHFGTEFDALDWLSIRLGYNYRPSSVKEEYWDNNWPIIDYHVFSIGSGFKVTDNLILDLAYSYSMGDGDWDVEDRESRNLTQDRLVYAPLVGSNVETETDLHNLFITFIYQF